jgi:hypothetical protein
MRRGVSDSLAQVSVSMSGACVSTELETDFNGEVFSDSTHGDLPPKTEQRLALGAVHLVS